MHLIRVLWQLTSPWGLGEKNEQEVPRLESKVWTHQLVTLHLEPGWRCFWQKVHQRVGHQRMQLLLFRNTYMICWKLFQLPINTDTSPGLALEVHKVRPFPHHLILWSRLCLWSQQPQCCSMEQRKAYCRAKQGERVARVQNPLESPVAFGVRAAKCVTFFSLAGGEVTAWCFKGLVSEWRTAAQVTSDSLRPHEL